jgi:hypothetical protein
MKSNPGGELAPDEVLGRDRLIQRLWQILEQRSLVLTAERRMGKTSVIKKMRAEPQADWHLVYRDVEAFRTPLEFVDAVYQDVREYLGIPSQAMARARQILKELGGLELQGLKLPTGIAPHWKAVLTHTIEDLVEHQDGRLIFLWDELPIMLDNISKDEGEKVAMEVLDVLRSLRQTHPNLRMVFTGSIGLHHVVNQLKQAGYTNAPTNDMDIRDVPPLALADAQVLAHQLFMGESLVVDNPEAMAKTVAEAVDCVAYYIHHVVNELKWRNQTITAHLITEIVTESLCDPDNRWDMAHYRDRIDSYYDAADQPLALGLLDTLAMAKALGFAELFEQMQLQTGPQDREATRQVLRLLQRDHYVIQNHNSTFSFRFPLIRQYWQLSRGL